MNEDTFIASVFGDRLTYDPHLADDEASIHVVQNIYETPFSQLPTEGGRMTFTSSLSPDVPSSVDAGTVSRDGKSYRFRVRDGVLFHGGQVLTTKDLWYSLVRSLVLADRRSPMLTLARLIWDPKVADDPIRKARQGEQVLDAIERQDTSVTLHLGAPFAPALSVIANCLFILPTEWAIEEGDWDASPAGIAHLADVYRDGGLGFRTNGTGPYMVARHSSAGAELRRHEDYWGSPGYFRRVEIQKVDEPADRQRKLLEGAADFAVCSRNALPSLAEEPGVRVYDDLPELNVNPFAAFNFRISSTDNPFIGSGTLDGHGIPSDFFSDVHVRRACALAFDYERFKSEGLGGRGKRALGVIPSRLVPAAYSRELLTAIPVHDLQAARSEWDLAHAGALGRLGCTFDIVTLAMNPERILAAEILAEGISRLGNGVKVSVQELDWVEYLAAMRDMRAPVYWTGWQADYGDPHSLAYSLLHSTGPLALEQGFSFPELDAVIDSAVAAEDSDRRAQLYQELNMRALELLPQLYTYERERFVVLKADIRGFTFNPFRASVFYYRDLYREGSDDERASSTL
jgi:peptide/nickel transport system substrate-binding protein